MHLDCKCLHQYRACVSIEANRALVAMQKNVEGWFSLRTGSAMGQQPEGEPGVQPEGHGFLSSKAICEYAGYLSPSW